MVLSLRAYERSVALVFLALALAPYAASAQARDQIAPTLTRARRSFTAFAPRNGAAVAGPTQRPVSAASDSVPAFRGEFQAAGVGPSGAPQKRWFYAMAGGRPELGGTTVFDAPIVPVSLDLLDYDGSVRVVNGHRLHYSVLPFVRPVVNSPVFQTAEYSSSDVPTQFADAVMRAEFYNTMQNDWHTLLRPSVKAERTLAIPRGSYFFALEDDGSCCAFVLVDSRVFSKLMFPASPPDSRSPVRAAERTGEITTRSISTFLFPNTYLYLNGNPNRCCVLGFHTYDSAPGDAANGFREKRYVLNFSSWISPGLFGSGFEDVTALSHEVTESLHDPFVGSDGVYGITPWWLSANGNCQNDLEVGDAIEGLPDATIAIRTNGRTYHPQNVALLQWFAFQSPSTALGGAYSYPNQSVLTSLSSPQGVNCQ
ncbi:MAG TPA: hypothetical protein VFB00_11075 [Terriglobales bacterium]|nr:hypothetical protein [Terriglobales bacterium]